EAAGSVAGGEGGGARGVLIGVRLRSSACRGCFYGGRSLTHVAVEAVLEARDLVLGNYFVGNEDDVVLTDGQHHLLIGVNSLALPAPLAEGGQPASATACWPSEESTKSRKSLAVSGLGAPSTTPMPRGNTTVPSSG